MHLLRRSKEEPSLEERVINKINSFYLVERKSSEVLSLDTIRWDRIPITTTKEVNF